MKSSSFRDIKLKRGPQVITRKDASIITGETGLKADWNCLDLGGGSGFLSLFIANLLTSGKITTYEISPENSGIIKENAKRLGFTNIKIVNKPAEKFTGRNFDLITVDMKGAEDVVAKCYKALKANGWLVIYSPHVEQQISCRKEMEKAGFAGIRMIENVQREWKVDVRGFTHPIHSQLVHTGFITFARKI